MERREVDSVSCDGDCKCKSGRQLIGLSDRQPVDAGVDCNAFPERAPTPSERASELVNGPRQKAYGHPLPNHERIAAFWTVRLREKLKDGEVIEPHEAAACVRLVKEARLMETRGHRDSLDDIAGYADVEWLIHDAQAEPEGGA